MKHAFANNVKRVVITSSIAAIMGKLDRSQTHFTSEDWTEMDSETNAFLKSKTLAE